MTSDDKTSSKETLPFSPRWHVWGGAEN